MARQAGIQAKNARKADATALFPSLRGDFPVFSEPPSTFPSLPPHIARIFTAPDVSLNRKRSENDPHLSPLRLFIRGHRDRRPWQKSETCHFSTDSPSVLSLASAEKASFFRLCGLLAVASGPAMRLFRLFSAFFIKRA